MVVTGFKCRLVDGRLRETRLCKPSRETGHERGPLVDSTHGSLTHQIITQQKNSLITRPLAWLTHHVVWHHDGRHSKRDHHVQEAGDEGAEMRTLELDASDGASGFDSPSHLARVMRLGASHSGRRAVTNSLRMRTLRMSMHEGIGAAH